MKYYREVETGDIMILDEKNNRARWYIQNREDKPFWLTEEWLEEDDEDKDALQQDLEEGLMVEITKKEAFVAAL